MLKTTFIVLLLLLALFISGSNHSLAGLKKGPEGNTGKIEKMIVANGSVTMDLNLNQLNVAGSGAKQSGSSVLRFDVVRDSFLTVIAFNEELRGALPGTMELVSKNSASVPARLNSSLQNLVFEKTPWGEQYEFVIRDGKTGFVFFNIEGHEYGYDMNQHLLQIQGGRMLLSNDFAAEIGQEAGSIVGQISVTANMRPIEVTQIVDGEAEVNVLPAQSDPDAGTNPGPDVVVGDLNGLAQFGGSNGTQVGLAVGTDSCNFGTVDLNWFANPSNDHPVIPQNLYRMSGGANNDARFEQIGQSSVKHAFTALTQNLCSLGCNGVGGTRLGSGCSDPYGASLNSGPSLGSRAWINPFSGAYPRDDNGSATRNNNHDGHTHTGPTHRILTDITDLSTSLNPGATYYAEAQYITPHEYVWCQANPTQCNMYNNVSYRRYNVVGTGSPFTFSPVSTTVRTKTAISAWTGATIGEIRPAPGVDGIGAIGYKVTNPSPGVWHYEYAIYNQNMDRAVQSFGVPLGSGVTISNIGFHAPPQHPGSPADGTLNSAGFSSAPWTQTQTSSSMTWSSETFAQNPNANAIRWGTMYNFRFDSNRPPQTTTATIGFLKTGSPITVQVQGPSAAPAAAVSVSGRVTTSDGDGLFNARVTLVDSNGNTRIAITNPFGYYRIDNIASGGMYTISAASKRYTFAPAQTLQISENLTNMNFVAQP